MPTIEQRQDPKQRYEAVQARVHATRSALSKAAPIAAGEQRLLERHLVPTDDAYAAQVAHDMRQRYQDYRMACEEAASAAKALEHAAPSRYDRLRRWAAQQEPALLQEYDRVVAELRSLPDDDDDDESAQKIRLQSQVSQLWGKIEKLARLGDAA